jgi:hypothetical protein
MESREGREVESRFVVDGKEYQAVEQNPENPSWWGKQARDGGAVKTGAFSNC